MVLKAWLPTLLISILSLQPLLWISYSVMSNQAGADPAVWIVQQTGIWALRLMWLLLLIGALKSLHSLRGLLSIRRLLGLWVLIYSILHLLAYCTFMLGWRLDLILSEITQRVYLIYGMLALLILLLMGMTSSRLVQRAMGVWWRRLHALIYLAAMLVLVHFWLQVRAGYAEQMFYTLALGLIVSWKLVAGLRGRAIDNSVNRS